MLTIIILISALHAASCMLSSEIFVFPLTNEDFSISSTNIKYLASVLDKPDLPSWIHYTLSQQGNGYLYGTPPKDIQSVQLEVIALDEDTFETDRKVFKLMFDEVPDKVHQVRFKVTNMNVDELLRQDRLDRLRSVLVDDLWPESEADGAFTAISPATLEGDRLPVSPEDKEGVYVTFGSAVPFSLAIQELEAEVRPLWQHRPCPKYFKKASYERFFRHKGFAIDWCSFKPFDLTTKPKNKSTVSKSVGQPMSEPISFIKRSEVPFRSYVWDMIYTILIPLIVMFALLGLLTLAMCCHRFNMDVRSSVFFDEVFDVFPRPNTEQAMNLSQHPGVDRALRVVRSVKRGCSQPSSSGTATTHLGTLERSYTESPSGPFIRGPAAPSRFDDCAAYNRPVPPPYHKRSNLEVEDESFEISDDF